MIHMWIMRSKESAYAKPQREHRGNEVAICLFSR